MTAPAHGADAAHDLSGTYVLTAPMITMTLVLRQDTEGALHGTLSSTSGAQFQVDGEVRDGVGHGACVGTQGVSSYFRAYPDGEHLLVTLIEPGLNNALDWNDQPKLPFVRRSGGRGPAPPATGPPPCPVGLGETDAPTGDEVGHPSWSCTFRLPTGWRHQKGDQGARLEHNAIPGCVLVVPHHAANLHELQWGMQRFQDETLALLLAGPLQPAGTTTLIGEYTGIAQGCPAQARAIGVLAPQEGGAYVIAITPPPGYGSALTTAAETVAGSLRGVPRDASDLVAHFAGTWVTVTRNTQTMVALYPNGTFAQRYDAGYSGGDQAGSWGVAREDHAQGLWAVRGTKQQGVLILTNPDGSQATVRYQVHVERGQIYWQEYFFNGELYARQ